MFRKKFFKIDNPIALLVITFALLIVDYTSVKAQNDNSKSLFIDNSIITQKIESLLKSGISEVVVIQLDSVLTSADSCFLNIHSIIYWNKDEEGHLIIISCDRIYKTMLVKKINAFNYRNRNLTPVTKEEINGLEKPFVVSGNSFFYFSRLKSFYFEVPKNGTPDSYASIKKYEKFREEWYKMFKKYLENIKLDNVPYEFYERFSDFKK